MVGTLRPFFFAYDGINSTIRVSSARLLSFVNTIYPRPPETLFQTQPSYDFSYLSKDYSKITFRTSDHLYKKLILVGHSEGCVVIRKAVLDVASNCAQIVQGLISAQPGVQDQFELFTLKMLQDNISLVIAEARPSTNAARHGYSPTAQFSILESELCLFAPAHLGSSITGIWGFILELPGLSFILRPFLRYSTSQVELRSDSPVLGTLRQETEYISGRFQRMTALKANIIWGENDKVVFMGRYRYDLEEDPVPGHDRTSTCKSTFDFLEPLRFVQYGKAQRTAYRGPYTASRAY